MVASIETDPKDAIPVVVVVNWNHCERQSSRAHDMIVQNASRALQYAEVYSC